MVKLFFKENDGYYPEIHYGIDYENSIFIEYPIRCNYLTGETEKFNYTAINQLNDSSWNASHEWISSGYKFVLSDNWVHKADGCILLKRSISVDKLNGNLNDQEENGFQLHFQLSGLGNKDQGWRFCLPSNIYSTSEQLENLKTKNICMDDRLTYPLITGYNGSSNLAVSLIRTSLPSKTEQPARPNKEKSYLLNTEIGSIGYSVNCGDISFHAYWPYYEGDKSPALNSNYDPVSAYYPLNSSRFKQSLSYQIDFVTANDFADAVYKTYKIASDLNVPEPVDLPFSLEESVQYRSESLKETYKEFGNNGAGFFFHFDPLKGYESDPSGFSASFITIPDDNYRTILEYGFTGRQLNAAYVLAKQDIDNWMEKGKKVVDFFVDNCTTSSGWLYSFYNLRTNKPFSTIGDPEAPRLHYISPGVIKGNYLRCMAEPAYDLLLNYQLHKKYGVNENKWLNVCISFADFLVKYQNADGSWHRAYEPNGTPLKNTQEFGNDDVSSKGASMIPIIFLMELAKELGPEGDKYISAAQNAGNFVIHTYVEQDHYQGGTLDNPNVVDKEASLYTYPALLALYDHFKDEVYLTSADRAAKIFLSWNYIWNAPNIQNTILGNLDFKTVGLGGINSIWGGGVVDIYSLFFIRELDRLGILVNKQIYCDMANWIAIGTQQVLSYPEDLLNFKDIGMQPEGFGICNQGIDNGMIAKGDIWGTLGWIYSAGICGLGNYLEANKIYSLK